MVYCSTSPLLLLTTSSTILPVIYHHHHSLHHTSLHHSSTPLLHHLITRQDPTDSWAKWICRFDVAWALAKHTYAYTIVQYMPTRIYMHIKVDMKALGRTHMHKRMFTPYGMIYSHIFKHTKQDTYINTYGVRDQTHTYNTYRHTLISERIKVTSHTYTITHTYCWTPRKHDPIRHNPT